MPWTIYQGSCLMTVVIVCVCIESCHCNYIYRGYEGLTEVPADIPTDATDLDLYSNYITALRDCEVCQYTELYTLYLGYNLISVISSTAFQHTDLVMLDLIGNQLLVLPDLHFIAETLFDP